MREHKIWCSGILITVLNREGLNSKFLLEKRGWILKPITGEKIAYLIKMCGQIFLKPDKNVRVIDEAGCDMRKVRIRPYHLYSLYKKDSDEIFTLLTEPMNSDTQIYKKYRITGNADISIGRDSKCDLCFRNALVSARHAVLLFLNDTWTICDKNSTNGIYVNDIRVMDHCKLKAGDRVYIMGLRMIIGKSFVAINNPAESVELNEERFVPYRQ